jgi:predicted negative regulator of RcsB-dependent stress response
MAKTADQILQNAEDYMKELQLRSLSMNQKLTDLYLEQTKVDKLLKALKGPKDDSSTPRKQRKSQVGDLSQPRRRPRQKRTNKI